MIPFRAPVDPKLSGYRLCSSSRLRPGWVLRYVISSTPFRELSSATPPFEVYPPSAMLLWPPHHQRVHCCVSAGVVPVLHPSLPWPRPSFCHFLQGAPFVLVLPPPRILWSCSGRSSSHCQLLMFGSCPIFGLARRVAPPCVVWPMLGTWWRWADVGAPVVP